MAAFIVVDTNNPQINALVFNAPIPITGAGSWRLSQGTNNRRSAYCGSATSTFRVGYPHLAPVSRRVKFECHLVASLEDTLLGFGWCFATISCRGKKHDSHPILDSLGCLDHSNLAEDLSSHSGGSLTPNSLVSAWTWHSAFCLKKKWLQRNIERFMIFNKWRRWSHSSRVKFSLVGMSASWFLVSAYLIWILGSKLILSNNQSSATLWVLDTCLIVGLRPLMIILITASLSSNTYNKASWRADWTLEGTASMSFITSIFLWGLWRLWTSYSGCPDRSGTRETCPRTETIRSQSSRAGIQSQSSVQRDDFRFCWTVRNISLFLAHPTYWNKCMTSKNAQCSSRSGFWIFKISRKVRILKQSQSALFGSITHMTILFVFTSMMNIWNQSIQAFVTGLGPFCDGSCELICWP